MAFLGRPARGTRWSSSAADVLASTGGPGQWGGSCGNSGELPEGEAAAAAWPPSARESVSCTLEGSLIWANDRFRAFDDQTRARITAVCRRAAAQYEEQILRQEAAGFSFGSHKFDVASPDESRFYEVVVSLPVRMLGDGWGPGGSIASRLSSGMSATQTHPAEDGRHRPGRIGTRAT